VYAFAKELLKTRKVCAATYERAIAEIGLTAVVELVGILGYYSLVSLTINAFEVPPPFPPYFSVGVFHSLLNEA
jgi:4-carboxymuconolactone decarboxylase